MDPVYQTNTQQPLENQLPAFMVNANEPPRANPEEDQNRLKRVLGGFGGSRKKTIATILGILLLVVGVGAGVVLVQQRQLQEKAAVQKCDGWANPGEVHCNTQECQQYTCGSDGRWQGPQGTGVCASHPDCQTKPPQEEWEYITFICDQCSPDRRCQTPDVGVNPRMIFGNQPGACNQVDRRPKGSTTQNWELVSLCETNQPCVIKPTPTPTPTLIPTSTPTPAADISAQCLNIKAFDKDWNELSMAELAKLKPKTIVRFTVVGSATSGSFDMGRFTINGVQRNPVTAKRPGTQEFYDEYTIPEIPTGQTSLTITVNAEIHHTVVGWI